MDSKLYDLTEGGILKKLLLVAVPIMGIQFMQMTYNLTDMFWLGRMDNSVTAVAASGLAGLFLWLSEAFLLIGRTGAEIGTAQNLGRRDLQAARSFSENSVRISIILGLAYGAILIIFTGPLVSLLQVKEDLLFSETCAYLRIVGVGIPFFFVSGSITGTFTGAGNSRLSFRANALGLIVNMILDPLMILYLGWGVRGAAIATVIAQIVVFIIFIYYSKHHRNRPFSGFKIIGRIHGDETRVTLAWSLPIAAESGAFTLLSMVVTAMAAAWYGEMAVAVHRVGTQIESLSWLIGVGFSSAITAFVGQNYGAGLWQRIRRAYKLSLAVLMVWELLVTLLLIGGGTFLFAIFISEPAGIVDMGGTYLKILAASQIFMAFESACSGAFRGIGKTLPPSLCSIISNLIRPLLCWIFVQWMGMNGLWVGITVSAALRGLSMFIWYSLYQRKHIPLEKDWQN